jgi:hypothetical protein
MFFYEVLWFRKNTFKPLPKKSKWKPPAPYNPQNVNDTPPAQIWQFDFDSWPFLTVRKKIYLSILFFENLQKSFDKNVSK